MVITGHPSNHISTMFFFLFFFSFFLHEFYITSASEKEGCNRIKKSLQHSLHRSTHPFIVCAQIFAKLCLYPSNSPSDRRAMRLTSYIFQELLRTYSICIFKLTNKLVLIQGLQNLTRYFFSFSYRN